MNRVLIFVDDDIFSKTPTGDDPLKYYGIGLGTDIVTVSSIAEINEKGEVIQSIDYDTLRQNQLRLGEGDRALIVGKKAWDILCKVYHNGLRAENGFDASRLDRLGLNCGAFIKVLWGDKDYGMDKVDIPYFMSDEFIKKWDYSAFKQVIVSKFDDAIRFLTYLNSLTNEEFGFDYETNGMADIPNFEISGCSICTTQYGAFFSFTDIRRNSTPEQYKEFCNKFAEFIVNHQSRIWAYNLQFEQQVSFRYFGIDVELCDSAVYNIIEGFHSKRYSLKWTAQRVLNKRGMKNSGIRSWDDDFDYLNEILHSMYLKRIPNPENPKETVEIPNCSIDNFESTPEFQEVARRYPQYVDEFKLLIRENFSNTFMNIPSAILGYYCNLDSYNTLCIRDTLRNDYTQTCVDIYLDNVRLGAALHSGGMYKDMDYHARYQEQCNQMMAYGITYSATVYSKLRMDYFRSLTKDIDKYNDSCKLLLGRGEFMKGDVIKIAKYIISNNLSDLYESGTDEPTIYERYGEVIYTAIIEGLKEAKCKADKGFLRKKKPFECIGQKLTDALGLNKLYPDENLENYMFYQIGYESFLDIWSNQMKDIYHVPSKFTFLGVTYDVNDYVDKIKKTYFPCTSPKEYEVMLEFLMERYRIPSAFLSMIYNNLNRIDIKKIFDQLYKNVNGRDLTIEECYDHFVNNIATYPQELKDIVSMYLSDPMGERMTDTFDDARGFWKQADYWEYIRKDYDTLVEPYSENDFNNLFKFLRKFCILQCLFRKYVKVNSTYINGLFKSFDKVVHDTPKLIPDVAWDQSRNDNVVKMFPRYLVCEKDTKRWSSGYHTIISHSDIKRIVTAPPGYLLTYFDISSAEVRSIAYKSGDPTMINLFESGQDLYVHIGKIAFPDLDWTTKAVKKAKRPIFKQVLLGSLYGMGFNTLAKNSGVSVDEAKRIHKVMFDEFHVLRDYTDKLFDYPLHNDGYIQTFYGDKLRTSSWKYRFDPKTGRENSEALARASRHGCNYCIQNGSAITLAAGFWNNIRVAKKYGITIRPIICVHDSNTNYVPAGFMPYLRPFYDENFTGFTRNFTGVPFLYDLFIGANYNDCCLMEQLSTDTIRLSGSNSDLNKILYKLDEAGVEYQLNKDRRDFIPEYVTNPIERFIRDSVNTNIEMDISEGDVEIKFNLEQYDWGGWRPSITI